jgi:hypothetical protein
MTCHRALLIGACAGLLLAGSAKAYGQRPIKTEPIASGAGTVEGERKRLEGRWTLVSLKVTPENGAAAAVDATGVMTFDDFGNLQIEYRMSDAGRRTLEGLGIRVPGPVLSTSGSVAIDPVTKQITYVGSENQKRALGFDPDLAARRANPFTLERVRHYEFEPGGDLTLATRHEGGSAAAEARWRRAS